MATSLNVDFLEVFRDSSEFVEHLAARPGTLHRTVEAMIDMIVDQGFFRIVNRVFYRLQLLGKIDAGGTFLDHRDDCPKMALSPLEAPDNLWVALVRMTLAGHKICYPVWRLSDPPGRISYPAGRIVEIA
jgi:hypothetical protein